MCSSFTHGRAGRPRHGEVTMADEEIHYSADHVLDHPYVRSVGPVIGAFLTGLRDGKVVGIKGTGGKVIVPPTEYDPDTGEETSDIVAAGPRGPATTGPGG